MVQSSSKLVMPILAIVLALIIGALVIWLMGISPWMAYKSLLKGSLGSTNSIAETLVKSAPLIFTGLSFALAYRCGLINIGAEGQLYMGGFASALAGIYLQGLPLIVHLPLALAAGFIAGGLWGLLAGWLKVRFGASEIITTVMLNYVATYWVSYVVTGPMKEPPGTFPQTALVAATAQLPRILTGTRLHLGFLVAILALIFYFVFLWRTPRGFELRVVGQNPQAAGYAGMSPNASVLLAMFLAGGMGGLAGAGEILGVQRRLLQAFSPGYGFDGIAVALLGLNVPTGIFLAAILFGILRSGGNTMQMFSGVPVALIYIIQALVIFFVVSEHMFKLKGKNPLKTMTARDPQDNAAGREKR